MASVNNPRFGTTGTGTMGRQSSEREGGQQSLGGAAGDAMESIKEGAQNLASTASSAAEQAWESTKQGAQQVAHVAENAYDTTTDFMRRYPLVTLGIGLCMGACLCLMLRRD